MLLLKVLLKVFAERQPDQLPSMNTQPSAGVSIFQHVCQSKTANDLHAYSWPCFAFKCSSRVVIRCCSASCQTSSSTSASVRSICFKELIARPRCAARLFFLIFLEVAPRRSRDKGRASRSSDSSDSTTYYRS